MSTVQIAVETPETRINVPVKSRKHIGGGGIVAYTIPTRTRKGSFEENEQKKEYLEFFCRMKGGGIHVFVHNNLECAGKEIVARADVMRKELTDGRVYFYVDLWAVDEATRVTRELRIVEKGSIKVGSDWQVFKTRMPGMILFIPVTKMTVMKKREGVMRAKISQILAAQAAQATSR